MSPLETAKAFGAPLLEEYNSNMKVEDLIKNGEYRMVRYGTFQCQDGGSGDVLRLADVKFVQNVQNGALFTR